VRDRRLPAEAILRLRGVTGPTTGASAGRRRDEASWRLGLLLTPKFRKERPWWASHQLQLESPW